jgi:hypothetical protein
MSSTHVLAPILFEESAVRLHRCGTHPVAKANKGSTIVHYAASSRIDIVRRAAQAPLSPSPSVGPHLRLALPLAFENLFYNDVN